MAARTFRTVFPLSLMLLVILWSTGCETSPTDNDKDNPNDTTETNDSTDSFLAGDGSKFNLIDSIDYADPGQSDRREDAVVNVSTDSPDYAGKSDVHHYQMFAGFVTDRVFHGSVAREPGGDLSIYYAGNMQFGNTFWWFRGWLPYPLSGGEKSIVLHDSTSPSGKIRQKTNWTARHNGTQTVTVSGKSFEGEVIDWEMETTRWVDGEVEQTLLYSGRDVFVPELKFAAERYIDAYVDDELWFSSKSWLASYTLK